MYRLPFTNFHALNLDWFLSQWNKFLEKIDDKIASVAGITADADSVSYNTPASVEVTGGGGTETPYHMQFHIPRGAPVTITTSSVKYAVGGSGTTPPSAEQFTETIPPVASGAYLWTRTNTVYSDGTVSTAYSVARQGIDGMGAVDSVNEQVGVVVLGASDINMESGESIEMTVADITDDITDITNDVGALQTKTTPQTVTGFSLGSDASADLGCNFRKIGNICQAHLNITMNDSSAWAYNHAIVGAPHALRELKFPILYPKRGVAYVYPTGEINLQWFESFTSSGVVVDFLYFCE